MFQSRSFSSTRSKIVFCGKPAGGTSSLFSPCAAAETTNWRFGNVGPGCEQKKLSNSANSFASVVMTGTFSGGHIWNSLMTPPLSAAHEHSLVWWPSRDPHATLATPLHANRPRHPSEVHIVPAVVLQPNVTPSVHGKLLFDCWISAVQLYGVGGRGPWPRSCAAHAKPAMVGSPVTLAWFTHGLPSLISLLLLRWYAQP